MLRINQFAKEVGVTNQDVIDALEKRLGIPGKSHSSNLTDDQISQLRRVLEGKSKGAEETTPLALHRPTTSVKVVKGEARSTPAPEPPTPARPASAVLVKKAEPRPVVEPPASEPAPVETVATPALPEPVAAEAAPPTGGEAESPSGTAQTAESAPAFSKLRVSQPPAPPGVNRA